MKQDMNSRFLSTPRLLWILLAAVLLAVGGLYALRQSGGLAGKAVEGNLSGSAIVDAFSLVDETGANVTSDSYQGKWRLMYFGFTYCPDVCPTDMATLGAALKAFEEKEPARAEKLVPLFLTVDPERDTPEVLREFTNEFHPRLVGLTGSRAQVDEALQNMRIYSQKIPGPTEDSYSYDHMAVFYLMDPNGRPVEFTAGLNTTTEELLAMFDTFVR